MGNSELLKMYVNMSEEEKIAFSKYITIRYDISVNPIYAKTLINPIDGCLVCGNNYDAVMRKNKQ